MTLTTAVSGPTPWRRLRRVIPGTSTFVVDIAALSQLKAAKYFVSISNEVNSRYNRFELNVTNENSNLRDTISNKFIAGGMNIELTVKVNGVNAELEVINNETFDLDIELIRGVFNV